MNEFVSRISYDTISATNYFTQNKDIAMEEARTYFMNEDLDFTLFMEYLCDDVIDRIAIDLGVEGTISRKTIETKILDLGLMKLLNEFDDDVLQKLYNKFGVKCKKDFITLVINEVST